MTPTTTTTTVIKTRRICGFYLNAPRVCTVYYLYADLQPCPYIFFVRVLELLLFVESLELEGAVANSIGSLAPLRRRGQKLFLAYRARARRRRRGRERRCGCECECGWSVGLWVCVGGCECGCARTLCARTLCARTLCPRTVLGQPLP